MSSTRLPSAERRATFHRTRSYFEEKAALHGPLSPKSPSLNRSQNIRTKNGCLEKGHSPKARDCIQALETKGAAANNVFRPSCSMDGRKPTPYWFPMTARAAVFHARSLEVSSSSKNSPREAMILEENSFIPPSSSPPSSLPTASSLAKTPREISTDIVEHPTADFLLRQSSLESDSLSLESEPSSPGENERTCSSANPLPPPVSAPAHPSIHQSRPSPSNCRLPSLESGTGSNNHRDVQRWVRRPAEFRRHVAGIQLRYSQKMLLVHEDRVVRGADELRQLKQKLLDIRAALSQEEEHELRLQLEAQQQKVRTIRAELEKAQSLLDAETDKRCTLSANVRRLQERLEQDRQTSSSAGPQIIQAALPVVQAMVPVVESVVGSLWNNLKHQMTSTFQQPPSEHIDDTEILGQLPLPRSANAHGSTSTSNGVASWEEIHTATTLQSFASVSEEERDEFDNTAPCYPNDGDSTVVVSQPAQSLEKDFGSPVTDGDVGMVVLDVELELDDLDGKNEIHRFVVTALDTAQEAVQKFVSVVPLNESQVKGLVAELLAAEDRAETLPATVKLQLSKL